MPLLVGQTTVGWVNETLARQIHAVQAEAGVGERAFDFEWPQCRVGPDGRPAGFDSGAIALRPELLPPAASLQARSDSVNRIMEAMFKRGLMRGWRGELQGVGTGYGPGAAPLLLVERGAVPYLGVCSYGCHVNVYSRGPGGEPAVWIAQRSKSKPTYPGLLDQCVAGGLPSGLSVRGNVAKECEEEAGFPPALAAQAVPAGAVRYCYSTRKGLSPKTLFVFDLEVPEDVMPVNQDGEVEGFARLPLSEAIRDLRADPARWKPNSALVLIDFAVRRGALCPDAEPDYLPLLHLLRASAGLPQPAPAPPA